MKFYLASSFSLADRVEQVAAALEAEGHEIAVRWWDRTFNVEGEGQVHTQVLKRRYNDMPPDSFYARPECEYAFLADMQGIQESGALVMVASDEPRDYAGASVEIGYAIGVGRPVFLLGRLKNSAMYWPVKRCKDLAEVLAIAEGGASQSTRVDLGLRERSQPGEAQPGPGCPPGFQGYCVDEVGTACPYYHEGHCTKVKEEREL